MYHQHYHGFYIGDWSLLVITGRGAREVLPLRKGGAEKVFSHAEGGGTKSFGVVFMR